MIETFVLTKVFGWSLQGQFPDIPQSVIVVAPHTSYWDAVIGKLFLKSVGLNHKLLSKKELFFFPANIMMRLLGAIPVRGVKERNAILDVSNLFKENKNLHIVICPEGGFAPTNRWDAGFYYMAFKANVPIVVAYIDYHKKEVGIKGVLTDLSDKNRVFEGLTRCYKGVTARHPDHFVLPELHRK
ncbi:MAG: 1-acyl-sn-glycerol-3-phosphate acyltransferase [Parabacteroides gordonii]|uniref:1-acyl-sn-glycerol-3-phosphate acyltransferase n=1 Tax=Parabacteroides gordonii TaxID=574930 RepID=UPI003A8BD5AB